MLNIAQVFKTLAEFWSMEVNIVVIDHADKNCTREQKLEGVADYLGGIEEYTGRKCYFNEIAGAWYAITDEDLLDLWERLHSDGEQTRHEAFNDWFCACGNELSKEDQTALNKIIDGHQD